MPDDQMLLLLFMAVCVSVWLILGSDHNARR